MQEVEDRYRAASPEDRMAFHLGLVFYNLLTDEEHFALERRFPNELKGEPHKGGATEGTRVAWDLRSRELVVCMLQYGERVLAAGMDLVRKVEPDEDVAVLAMTATGSFLELDRPGEDGTRDFVYRASVRPTHELRNDGNAKLEDAILLGNPVYIGDLRTSELLIVAAGPNPAPDDDAIPGGALLFGPLEDALLPHQDDVFRVGMTRFRVLIDMAENCEGSMRASLHEGAADLACELQWRVSDGGGFMLEELKWFETGSGARYEVMQHDGLDLVRRVPDGSPVMWFVGARIGAQMVTVGAPLVVFYSGVRNVSQVAFMFRVKRLQPLGDDEAVVEA